MTRRRPDALVVLALCCLLILAGVALLTRPALALLVVPPLALLPRAASSGRLAVAARTDGKTGLLTATEWYARAGRELARAGRAGTATAVLMLDVDRLKPVNDRHGHLAGDAVLRCVAQALTEHLRDSDLAGRFGGDEFVVLLAGVTPEDALRVADRLRLRVAGHAASTVSIGVACAPSHGRSADELLAAADAACYAAKSRGGDDAVLAGQPTRNPTDSPTGSAQECTTRPTNPGG